MKTIYKGSGATVTLYWKIMRGENKVTEDLSNLKSRVFLIGSCNTYSMEPDVVTDEEFGNKVLKVEVDASMLSTGVYDVKAMWEKNDGRNIMKSVRTGVFAITDNSEEVGEIKSEEVIRIASYVESIGRDGLSAYEIAVIRGLNNGLSENDWVGNEAERIKAEQERASAETTRKENETARKNEESGRQSRFNTFMGASMQAFDAAQGDRAVDFAAAQGGRETAFTDQIQDFEARFNEAETARDNGERRRNQSYAEAEDKRDADYATAEANRDKKYSQAEATRDSTIQDKLDDIEGRFTTAENARKLLFNENERTRQTNEQYRIQAEGKREKDFQDNEQRREQTFQDNEVTRQSNEIKREAQESIRQQAEQIRIDTFDENERGRISAENERKQNETQREANEAIRQESYRDKLPMSAVVQETGDGENVVMSQKAVSERLYPYTEILTEVFINSEPFDLSTCFFVIRNTTSAQQVTLIDNRGDLANYWSQTKIESGIVKLTAINNSGIDAYVFVDFTLVSETKYVNIRNPKVFQKGYSPRIAAYINSQLMEAASESIEENARSIKELQIINKSYTDDMGVQCVLQEVYVESSLSNFARPTITVTDSGASQQVVINGYYDSEPIANYWSQTKIERGIIELTPYGDNGVKAYAYVDFTSYKSKLIVELKNNEKVLDIENSPRIAAYISRGNSENISELQNIVGKLASNCSYRDDNSYIDIVKEMYITGMGELSSYPSPTIKVTNKDTAQQVTLHSNYDAEPLANYWSQSLIDKGIIKLSQYSDSGIEGYVFVDFTNLANGSSVFIKLTKEDFKSIDYAPSIASHLNAIKIGEIESKPNNKWSGKRLLAIGDSITTEWDWEKHWASKCAAILDMNIRVHAKGGIGLIQMVDGDGSGDAPEGFDPDTFGVSNLYRLNAQDVSDVDIIVLMGMYNERGIANKNIGVITDMYPTSDTYLGRLNYAVERIYEELSNAGNSQCKVVVCSAHKYGKYPYSDLTGYDDGDNIRRGAEDVAKYHSLYFIDLMNGGNINKYNWDSFSASSTPYNSNYIPSDGVNDGTNKPFTSLSDAPSASSNNGKYITISGKEGCYVSDGTSWNYDYRSAPWNGDQLHLNQAGYQRMAEFIAGHLMNI